MNEEQQKRVGELFKSYLEIGLAYFFGSRAHDTAGPMSDYDFAVYFDRTCSPERMFDIRVSLIAELSGILKIDAIDVVVLNTVENSLLKYEVIKNGILLFEREPYKVVVEPAILNEYFDYKMMIDIYGPK